MAREDIACSFTLPKEIDKLITKLAQKGPVKVTRRAIIIQAVKLLAESK